MHCRNAQRGWHPLEARAHAGGPGSSGDYDESGLPDRLSAGVGAGGLRRITAWTGTGDGCSGASRGTSCTGRASRGWCWSPDAGDPPQTQFYGLGACTYGPYEVGTLWIYATDSGDRGSTKMHGLQTPELAYARAGTAWHRAEQGTAFIPNGGPGEWDCGNLQPASQPVFLDDEIRYYYAGTDALHSSRWEVMPQNAGLGLARLKPDRFVALWAGEAPAELGTITFKPRSVDVFVNARTADDGEIRVELQDAEARPLAGFTAADCRPINGDSTAHRVGVAGRWAGGGADWAADADPADGAAGQRVLGVSDGAG